MASRSARPVHLDIGQESAEDSTALEEQCPLLLLGLFTRTPFVSFGSVRIGSSRTALLAIENPNTEPVEVRAERVPEERGFSLSDHHLRLQPMEKMFVSIQWTPMEDGGVRETLTFVTNGIVKHRVILLGKAEQPAKKKKSLWEAIKKKNSSAASHSVRVKKKEAIVKTVNQTNCVSENIRYVGTERVRSPLQPCENLALAETTKSLPKSCKQNVENRTPLSPIGFLNTETCDATGSQGFLRNSSTHAALCMDTYVESLQEVATSSFCKRFHSIELGKHEHGKEHELPVAHSINVTRERHDGTSTPGSMRRSTTYSVLGASGSRELFQKIYAPPIAQDDFNFNVEKPLGPHAFVNACVTTSSINETPEVSLDRIPSPVYTPDRLSFFHTPLTQRRFLSPDSFVNDSYQPDEDIESVQIATILSPDQFVKENVSAIMPSVTPQEGDNFLLSSQSSSLNLGHTSCASSSSPSKHSHFIEEQFKESPLTIDCVENDFADVTVEFQPLPSRLTFFIKPEPESISLEVVKRKKGPVLSETVTKSKSNADEKNKEAGSPSKARRCLRSIMFHNEKTALDKRKTVRFLDLPVIDSVSCQTNIQEVDLANFDCRRPTLVGRKRKSAEFLENVVADVTMDEYAESSADDKTYASSMKAKKGNIQSGQVSRYKVTEDHPIQEKKPASQAFTSSSRKTHNVNGPKNKFTFRKAVQKDLQPQKLTPNLKTKRVVAVPQSQLTFVKPTKTAIPRHPMPFAAKNMFYDERWKEKQERGFTWWLNFILTPDDLKTDSSRVNAAAVILGAENHHKASVPKAPSKEEVSLKAYTARCRLNRLRRASCRLFTSETVVKAIRKLEIEIEAKRLLVRKDRHLWKDVGERQKILNWLLSYNPLWLRIGLETIFGELISLESNSDVMGLALFILNRLLWNPDIAAEYRHPSVPHLYRDGHEEALSKFTLKKLLLLVFFLDHAKLSRLIDHDPCLFCKDSDFKASKDVLLAFSRDFLSGEGDLSRHLAFLGLPVSHVQTPLDEFEFAVTNLAVDLQCGVRLVRAMELLTQNWTLSKKLRVPAISRLQKMHNTELALNVLKERNVPLKDEHGSAIDSRDIVDRHRERTLALLWRIVCAFQVDVLLNIDEVKEEIRFLKHSWDLQKMIGALKLIGSLPIIKRASSSNFTSLYYSENVGLLMEWVNATCAFYNTKVENFTVSFSDGRVLCYLIHHYHPSYVVLSDIQQYTTQTVECTQTGTIGLNSSSESENSLDTWPIIFDQTITTSDKYKELLENEKKNFLLLNAAVANLGGIPAMINHSDMSNTIPDEKVVITYLCFLCARLLDLRKETRAARVIQSSWRKYKMKAELELLQKRDQAAKIIQAAVIRFLHRCRFKKRIFATVVIQKNWKRYLAQEHARRLKLEKLKWIQCKAATIIQAHWRHYCSRRYYHQLRNSTIRMQARIRTKIAVRSHRRLQRAALTIQRHFRAWMLAKQERLRYKRLKASTVRIQTAFRQWKLRHLVKRAAGKEEAAVRIQSWYRMHVKRRWYLQLRQCAIKVQACFRGFQSKSAYETKKRCAITLQRHYRAYWQGKKEKEDYLRKRAAVVCLQAAFRGMKARKHFKQVRAVCLLQSFWRMRQERQGFLHTKHSVILLQSHVRKYQQRNRYRRWRKAATVIQARYRGYIAMKRAVMAYKRMASAAVVLQSAFRRMQSMKQAHQVRSAVIIQAYYRAYRTRKRFLQARSAATRIQALVRMRRARDRYSDLKKATLCVQKRYRANKCIVQHKATYRRIREACICVQAALRGHWARTRLQLWHKSATLLQAQYRMKRERQRYLQIRSAVISIQKHVTAYRAQVRQRHTFLKVKKSAICIQATYRGYRTRENLKMQVRAAVKIQAVFRSYSARKKFLATLNACLIIQRVSRACKTGEKVRLQFLNARKAAVCLQAAYRDWAVRRLIEKQNIAAVLLQSAYRKVLAERQFRKLKKAALTIQDHYRAHIARKTQQQRYLALKHATARLQAAWRGAAVRKNLERQRLAAIAIQSYYRMRIATSRFKATRQAATVIQCHYRAYAAAKKQRSLYLKFKSSSVVLQAAWRGRHTRKQVHTFHAAATTIQVAFKSFSLKKKYAALRVAAVTVQRWYRATALAKSERRNYRTLRCAAIQVQAAYRGLRGRKQVTRLHQAATTIQAAFRGHRLQGAYCRMKTAATVIQRRYRASCQSRQDRSAFLELRQATVLLQAAYRGTLARQELKQRREAAVRIQAYFRMCKQKKHYTRLVAAVQSMQRLRRACKETGEQVNKYLALKNAALIIQSAYRGLQTRRCLHARQTAATAIQRKFRSYLKRKRFLSLRKASIVVQQQYRLRKLGSSQRREYACLREAAITLQAVYRGFKVRKDLHLRHRAASVIQATFRMHVLHVRYRVMKMASITIQQHCRGRILAKRERAIFLGLRRAVVVLQAAYRGMKARRSLKKMQSAASLIQANYRMALQRRWYRRIQWATKVIQERARANGLRDLAVKQYTTEKNAARFIQATFRGSMTRKQLRRMRIAASVIQRKYRARLERRRFLEMKWASVTIQRRYRELILSRRQRQEYLALRKAVIFVQAARRGSKVRREIEEMHQAAITIQSTFRMHQILVKYKAIHMSASIIQRYHRAQLTRKTELENFLTVRKSAVKIQAAYRGMKVRQTIKGMHEAATGVQSLFRMHRQRVYYKRLCKAASTLQQRYRAKCAKDEQRQQYAQLRKAAVCFQASFRGMQLRKRLQEMHRAASIIQRRFKAYSEHRRYVTLRAAAIVCQRRHRTSSVARRKRQEFLSLRKAAVQLQSAYRGLQVRRMVQQMQLAATTIQSSYRMHRLRHQYQAREAACGTIQAFYRSYITGKRERAKYLLICKAVVVIQSFFRGMQVRRNVKRLHTAATAIQSIYRMHKQRVCYQRMHWAVGVIEQRYQANKARDSEVHHWKVINKATICIQTAFRAKQARQLAKESEAACCIQSVFKMYSARKKYVEKKMAALVIQSTFRGFKMRARYKTMVLSATVIQRWYRACHTRHLQRNQYCLLNKSAIAVQSATLAKNKQAATRIQAFLRMKVHRRKFLQLREAALTIQTAYRMYRAQKQYRMYRAAAVLLQTQYRSQLAMKRQREVFLRTLSNIISAQSVVRRFIAQKRLQKIKSAAITIQFREQKQQQRLIRFSAAAYHHLSALKIQRCYKVHLALKHAQKQIHMVVFMQSCIRTRFQRKKYLADRQKILKVQQAIREWVNRRNKSACVIQRLFRQYLAQRKNKNIETGVIKIQAMWRGYFWRSRHDTPKILNVRSRLVNVTRESKEENKLCNRTSIAIEYLLKYKHLSYILAALKHLEVATRLSSVCCENMAQSGAISNIFILIRSCNRSIPCMEVIKYSIQVLLNLSKYEKTSQAVYGVEKSVDTLTELMQTYREKAGDKVADKGGSIFTKTCCLLAILALDTERALAIRAVPKAVDRICSIYKLTVRKHKMDEQRTICKRMMKSTEMYSRNVPFTMQATPLRTRVVSRIKPDWILTKDNVKEIEDPLRAIRLVMDTLSIPQ
ncbi:abnormal spindle-like microcephaly-associated protein isoform X2 [Ambystoma mexicanum]|uniref:abnormal spindle-like microcephaly-associated protein isoform X2 n=1 Tax=Ambystoma mexicanum TaxID=8296 RepID=UPI0037E6FA46